MIHSHTIKISALLPNYNDAALLPKAILSLLNQTAPLTEIIIIDDGSTDNSLDIIHGFMQEHPHIRLIQHETNEGVCAALNHGIEQAIGDYVLLCAADDSYHPNMAALAKQAIQKYPRVGLICGDALVNRFDLSKTFHRTLPYRKKNDWITSDEFKTLASRGYVGFNGGGGMLINRQAILEAGKLYPQLRWHCDWLLYFAIAFRHGIYYIDQVFVHIFMRQNSYSEGKCQWKVQKQVLLDTIHILNHQYPLLWNDFKEAALLPHYDIRYLPLFLLDPILRRYFTFRLLWKICLNNPAVVRIGRLFPYRMILHARKLLKA